MKIRIISEGSTDQDYRNKRWGLSMLINEDILFDTFCSGDLLEADMDDQGVDIGKIRHIVLSHDHWDHTDGLWRILEKNPDVTVYICKNFGERFREKIAGYTCRIIEITKPVPITETIYSSGEIQGFYKDAPIYEQSLVIRKHGTLAVLTGCSHPGIATILKRIREVHSEPFDLVLGGFHLMNKSLEEIRETASVLISEQHIHTIAAFHCTGETAVDYFREHVPRNFQAVSGGGVFFFDTGTSTWLYRD